MADHSEKFVAALRNLPIFTMVEMPALEKVACLSRELHLERGEFLFQKEDQPYGFYVLLEGRMTLALPSVQGSERILEVIKPGETFGEESMFLRQPYPFYARTNMFTRLICIPDMAITHMMETDCTLVKKMMAGISIHLHKLVSNLESCSMRFGTQRVVCMLQHAAPTGNSMEYDVQLPVPKHAVASQLNLTPETFSRVLRLLAESGLIKVSGRMIRVINAEDLQKLAV